VRFAAAEAVVRAVVYEGYVLYPYRDSSTKNRQRWMFGTLGPAGGVEASALRVDCLVDADATGAIVARARFLQPVDVFAKLGAPPSREALERDVDLGTHVLADLVESPVERDFGFAAEVAARRDERTVCEPVRGRARLRAARVGDRTFWITVEVENVTPSEGASAGPDPGARREGTPLCAFASTHVLLGLDGGGSFCSMTDPPDALRAVAAACKNVGVWPALVARDVVLASPIILPDFPAIAPESAGDLFDATEIDEILTLRILTLADAEKDEIRRRGGRAAAILDRTEALAPDALSRLHGAVRARSGRRFRPGDRVRLAPRGGADVLDLALAGRAATVASVEEDFEGRRYVAVTVDDDPGQDLGRAGQPGHRFFFHPEEVEPLP
jgi:hypothetical protein